MLKMVKGNQRALPTTNMPYKLELLEDMSADCFSDSLRSFLAIHGPVSVLYSDRRTSFARAKGELEKETRKKVVKFMMNR